MPDEAFQEAQRSRRRGRLDFRDPKKHLVRIRGWLPAFQRQSKARRGAVRYLTLCAKEAIDVRYFAIRGHLTRNDARNEYPLLTFIEADEEDYAVIAETLGRVRLGVHAKLEEVLLDPTHRSYADLIATFPHDIVNLDFCGDIVPQRDHPYGQTIRCIDRILELQAAEAAADWDLFLTFRALRTRANDEANGQLAEIVEGNLDREEFRRAYGTRAEPARLVDEAYPEFLRIGIGKFLAHAARNRGYSVELESSWVYSRRHGQYHMVKLVARLRALREPNRFPNPQRETAAYDRAVTVVFESVASDVDTLITSLEAEVKEELAPVLAELDELGIVS